MHFDGDGAKEKVDIDVTDATDVGASNLEKVGDDGWIRGYCSIQ